MLVDADTECIEFLEQWLDVVVNSVAGDVDLVQMRHIIAIPPHVLSEPTLDRTPQLALVALLLGSM